MSTKDYKIDLCHGNIFAQVVKFALPLMGTFMLQLCLNAADLVIIGHYSPATSMAAIGATMSLNTLVVNLFIGISIGANVIVARNFGAKNHEMLSKTVHTAMFMAIFGGVLLMLFGLAISRFALVAMDTPPEILDQACTYIRFCFAGIPFVMIYNFGSSILRAVGDTRRPLYFLILAGVVNIALNLLFVIVFKWDVFGVALATTLANGLSAMLTLRLLWRSKDVYRMDFRKLRADKQIFREILSIGLPAGFQSCAFSISNMTIQHAINSFGPVAMAGITATLAFEGIINNTSFAFHQAAISFVAQNIGGRRYKRILHSLYICLGFSFFICLLMGFGFYVIGPQLLEIMTPDKDVIAWGMVRVKVIFTTYFCCSLLHVGGGGLRGMGHSLTSALNSLVLACGFRILWVIFVFPHFRHLEPFTAMSLLLISYPISWLLVGMINWAFVFVDFKKLLKENGPRDLHWTYWKPGVPRGFRFIVHPK